MTKHFIISALILFSCVILVSCVQKEEVAHDTESGSEANKLVSSSIVEESTSRTEEETSRYENSTQEEVSDYSGKESTVEELGSIVQSEVSSEVEASLSTEPVKRGIYLVTDNVPAAATKSAQHMFSTFSGKELVEGLEFTEDEAATARLSQGIKIGGKDEYADEAYYFFVLCGERVTALVISAPQEDETYGFQFGKDPLADAINTISTTKQNPAQIVATRNGFYSVDSTNGVQMLQQFIGSSVDGIEADKVDLMERINSIVNTGNVVLIE